MPFASQVRAAQSADLPEIAKLSRLVQRPVPENDEATIARHLSVYLSQGGAIFLAASQDGANGRSTLDGYVLCRPVAPLFYAVDRSIIMDVVFVAPSERRRGVGRALLKAVADYARDSEAGYVYAAPSAMDRPLHRFLASLGFAPLGGNRVVATSVLLRRLVREAPITQGIAIRNKARTPARQPIDEVIAKRKRARDTAGVVG